MLALELSENLHPITLLKVGSGFPFLEEFQLMEVLNILAFLTSTGLVDPFGLIISWLLIIVGVTVVLTSTITGEVNLRDLLEMLLSCQIVLSVSFWFTSARSRKTRASLCTASMTITFELIV